MDANDMSLPDDAFLIISDRHGIYIPQMFAQMFDFDQMLNIGRDEWDILLQGPEHEEYWDAWDWITQIGQVRAASGQEYILYQDGDLWAVPCEMG